MGLILPNTEAVRQIGALPVVGQVVSQSDRAKRTELSILNMNTDLFNQVVRQSDGYFFRPSRLNHWNTLQNRHIIYTTNNTTTHHTVSRLVEAMSSHGPYRAANSIEETLDEIEKYKGILYDPAAVDPV